MCLLTTSVGRKNFGSTITWITPVSWQRPISSASLPSHLKKNRKRWSFSTPFVSTQLPLLCLFFTDCFDTYQLWHVRNANYATKILLNFKSILNLEAPELSFIKVQNLKNGLGICALTQWSSRYVWRPSPQNPSRCGPPLLLQQSLLGIPPAASSTWPGRDRGRGSKG